MSQICLMGIGNVLMGDDALGPFVVESLQAAFELPRNVTVLDAGTPGLDLTLYLDGFDAIIAVDALHAGPGHVHGKPGEVRAFRRKDLLAGGLPIVLSPHEPTLREALFRLDVLGRCPPDVLLVGTYPERVETGTGLSPAVRAAVPFIQVQVLRELQRLGARATPRREPQPARIWWEAPAAV
jgi:hydrogenase maturation protease